MIVYKVVRGLNGNYKSCVVGQTGLCLRYRIGKTTRPIEGSKLFAFTELDRARSFSHYYGEAVLLGDSQDVELPIDGFRIRDIHDAFENIVDFWKGLRNGTSTVPSGTVLLPHFTPTAVAYC